MLDSPHAIILFDECRTMYRRLGRDAFRAQFPTPVLIQCRTPSEPTDQRFQTMQARRSEPEEPGVTRFGEVRPLRKRSPMAPFQSRIGVGRTATVDLAFPHHSVSKYHAFFELGDDGTWSLADAGSKNGTTVNGDRLARSTPVRMKDGDRVRFGRLDLLFCSNEGFSQLVASRVR